MYKTAASRLPPFPFPFLQVAVTALLVQCPAVMQSCSTGTLASAAARGGGRRGADCPGRQDRLTALTAYTLRHTFVLTLSISN